MGRPKRYARGGVVYHVLNRANARMTIFESADDYDAFERILEEAVARYDMRLLAYQVMPNHWHLVVRPREDGDLSRFVGWLTLTHTQRWHANRHSAGTGHVYQGRFKSFPVQSDGHFLTLCRYVERNALAAGLVDRAERWRWGSLWRHVHGDADQRAILSPWPIRRRPNWIERVNASLPDRDLAAILRSIDRGSPLGDATWTTATAKEHGLETTLRPRGRPKKQAP